MANKGHFKKGHMPYNKQKRNHIKCKQCSKDLFVTDYYKDKTKHCSRKCKGMSMKGNIPKSAFKKGYIPHNKGKTKNNYEPTASASKKVLGRISYRKNKTYEEIFGIDKENI